MQVLTRSEAQQYVRARASWFDAQPDPFTKSAWYLHFLEHVAQDDWKILAAEGAGATSCMLLYAEPAHPAAWRSLTNYYGSLFTPMVGQQDVRDLVLSLRRNAPTCHTLDLGPLDSGDPSTLALHRELSATGWYVRRYFAFGNWFLPAMPFDDYLASRDSKLRNTLQRKRKAFPGDLRIVLAPSEVEQAMDAYDTVYAKSWKKPEPYPRFVRDWAHICARQGWLRLGVATVRSVPVAVQFWMVVDAKAHIFKLAYDEAHAKLSAGSLLTALLMKQVLDIDKVSEVDYLTGDDTYKAAWMSHRRERIGLFACNQRTVPGLMRSAIERAAEFRQRIHRQAAVLHTNTAAG